MNLYSPKILILSRLRQVDRSGRLAAIVVLGAIQYLLNESTVPVSFEFSQLRQDYRCG